MKQLEEQRGLVTTSAGRLHFRALREGQGPLVLLHQISSSSRMFLSLMRDLAARDWASIAFDLPGFGYSDPPPPDHRVPDFARAIVEGLEEVGYSGPLPVLGHHTGARVAVVMAADHPDRVSELILIGLPIYESPEARSRRFAAKAIREIVPERSGAHLLHEWQRLWDLSPNSDPRLIHREFADTLTADAYDRPYAITRDHDLNSIIADVACPSLVISPLNDVQAANQRYAVSRLRRAELVEVDGGVFAVDESPGRIAEEVLGYLMRVRHETSRPS